MTKHVCNAEQDWWVSEYAEDIHSAMKEKEKRRKVFRARSPQLSVRKYLVDWLGRVTEKHSLSTLTYHLGVMFMDVFMDGHSIETEQLQLVALSCLLLAAKSEEKDILIPKTSELNRTADDQYRLGDFLQMEVALLDYFQWDLVMPTTEHFLDYYMKYAILDTDLKKETKVFATLEEGKIYAGKYAEYMKRTALRETVFLKFSPSLIAAACVAALRICLLIMPYWPSKLQEITGYKGPSLVGCVEYLLSYLEEDEKRMNTINDDSGISVDSPRISTV